MTHVIMMAAWPSFLEPLKAATLPTDPPSLAAYALLTWFVLLVWLGNRGSGNGPEGAEEEGDDDASSSSEAAAGADGKTVVQGRKGGPIADRQSAPRGDRRKLTRAQRRRKGHIDWIQ